MTCKCAWVLAPAKDEVVDVDILILLVAILLLFLGRQIFWLFVGGVGFVAAIDLVSRLATPWPIWLTLVVALAAGLVGALLAILLQEVAVGIAGFLAGGYIVLQVLELLGMPVSTLIWVLALVGAIVGAILALGLFDWALIVLSSLVGASIIARSFALAQPVMLLVFVVAAVVGIVVQARVMAGTSRREIV